MTLKQILQQYLPTWKGKLLAHHVGYLADGHVHRGVPYNALDPNVVAQKLALMQSEGIDGVVTTWQGPWAPACHQDAIMFAMKTAEMGMLHALLLDPGAMQKWTAGLTQSQITANVMAALQDPGTQAILLADSYVPEKFVLDFNTGASLSTLATTFPTLNFLAQSVGFSWPMIPWNSANYAKMNALPTMKVPGICSMFNDAGMPLPKGVQTEAQWMLDGSQRDYSQSVWGGPARILEHQQGQFLISQLPTIQASSPYIAIVTWDDVDEQSSGPYEFHVAERNGVDWTKF